MQTGIIENGGFLNKSLNHRLSAIKGEIYGESSLDYRASQKLAFEFLSFLKWLLKRLFWVGLLKQKDGLGRRF
jgi:hypothetical protein